MEKIKILLLEGGKRPSRQTQDELDAKGFKVTPVPDPAECLAALEVDKNYLVIIDLDMQRTGIEAVQKIRGLSPEIIVIVMSSLERLTVVDEALRQGAWDFVIKQPDFSHLHEIPQAIARSGERKRLKAEIELCRAEARKLQEENERYRDEAKRLQAEAERCQKETALLQSDLEESRRENQQPRPPLKSQEESRVEQVPGDEVLADITDDLKSPLAAMIGYLEIASNISSGRAEPNQILSIQRIDALARRLFDLVINHTEALDIEAGKFQLQKNSFEINQVLELAVQDRKGEAVAKNIELVLETSKDLPLIAIDPVQIERAVRILISNAIALSPLGGSVAVNSRLQGNEIVIAVRDSGAGIFAEEIPLLFDRKKKLRRRGADVTTVGLYVARHIATMHGGRIDVQSDPHEGTTLTIALPV